MAQTTTDARSATGWRQTRLALAFGCTALTIAVILLPGLQVVYPSLAGRVAVQTTSTLVGLTLTYLLFGRYLRTGRLDDLLLAGSFAVSGCGNLALLLFVVGRLDGFGLSAWAPAVAQLIAGLGIAVAGVAPSRPLAVERRRAVKLLLVGAAVFGGLLAGLIVLLPRLQALHLPSTGGMVHAPILAGASGVLAIQFVLVLANVVASTGFARKADRDGDRFAHHLSLAFAVAAFVRINYVLSPSLYSAWVSPGDAFRMASAAIMLWAAAREVSHYWNNALQTAAAEERRRIARDLHDGLAQELAFIVRRARRTDQPADALREIGAAADRALIESRRAIVALSTVPDEPFSDALETVADEVSNRSGVPVRTQIDRTIEPERATAEALLRIAREAMQNAAQHGSPTVITLQFDRDSDVVLRVTDDGHGIQRSRTSGGARGFGLVSMKERAAAIGASFTVASQDGQGTEVEVRLQ
jgi:signal transduction histidine kinase